MDLEKRYGIKIKSNRSPVRPIPIDLTGEAGRRLVLETAKRVMTTHADVLAAWRYLVGSRISGMKCKNGMRPVHPGEILGADYIRPMGLSVRAVALTSVSQRRWPVRPSPRRSSLSRSPAAPAPSWKCL